MRKQMFYFKEIILFIRTKILLLGLLVPNAVSAQLAITPGALFSVTGNAQITLRNTDFINNGNFTSGNSVLSFSGDLSNSISGAQTINFSQLEINKTGNSQVVLLDSINVSQKILFTAGFFNLNSFNTDLGTTGRLQGEKESSRFIGTNGGEIMFDTSLSFPNNSNPANLGILITSDKELGIVKIKRGHQVQLLSPSPGSSIQRYFEIFPENNLSLDATIQIKYFNGELNGLDEKSLAYFQSNNGAIWTALGFTNRDTFANLVSGNGIDTLSRFTLSSPLAGPLPVQFTVYHAVCQQDRVMILWETAQEEGTSRFDVEKSTDGIHWNAIGELPAAGNSSAPKSYSFADMDPSQNNFYRIAEYDADGRVYYTGVFRSACDISDKISIWPNPFQENVFINIFSNTESIVNISIFDSKGALVKKQKANLLKGTNQLEVDMATMTNGIYSMYLEWNHGQSTKAVQILKQ